MRILSSLRLNIFLFIKLHCDTRFQSAFTACSCVFKVIALVWTNQRNHFENATTCSKRMLKTTVATQLQSNNFFITSGLLFGQSKEISPETFDIFHLFSGNLNSLTWHGYWLTLISGNNWVAQKLFAFKVVKSDDNTPPTLPSFSLNSWYTLQ